MNAGTSTNRSNVAQNPNAADAATLEFAVRLIAGMEVLWGLFGAGRALALYLSTTHPISFVAMGLYIASVVCGVLLWNRSAAGFGASVALQALQIPWILTSKVAYAFASGIGLWLGAGEGGFMRDQALVSWFHFGTLTGWGISVDGGPWHIGVNVVAIAIVAFLISNWPPYKTRKTRRSHR